MDEERFECEAAGKRMIGRVVVVRRAGIAPPVVEVQMSEEGGKSIGPLVRVEFSIGESLKMPPEVAEFDAVVRRRAICEFMLRGGPEKIIKLARLGTTTAQVIRI
jgi:hypothetical protein